MTTGEHYQEVMNRKFDLFEALKVSPLSQYIDHSVIQKQLLDIYRADNHIRKRKGIEPDRRRSKKIVYWHR